MPILQGTWNSNLMQLRTHVTVCLPDFPNKIKATVILLHGLGGNCDDWMSRVGLELYSRKYSLAFVMPEVQRSWYTNMVYGLDYFGYISEEVPQLIAHYFNLPVDPEHLYIGGLSMGGNGTVRCALKHPDRYKGAMSFSARVFLDKKVASVSEGPQFYELQGILGLEREVKDDQDTYGLLEKAKDAPQKPKFYVACGTEDPLYPESVELQALLKENGFDVTYEEWAGIHSWDFWREALPRGLKTMGLTE